MNPVVSIVIPAYNKCYELELLLSSIERQVFDHSLMEVLVIDDGSSDETTGLLKNYRPPFLFRYVHNKVQKGRSYTRNIGIKEANGDILIFLDADSIVHKYFVANHVHHHSRKSNRVVTGAMHIQGIYSVYHPNFSKQTKVHIQSLLKSHDIYGKYRPLIQKAEKGNQPIPLLTKEDIAKGRYKQLSFPRPYFPEIIAKFGNHLDGYKLPWVSFLSGNISLRKELLTLAGSFDENFRGWGFEDWELGYRLYQLGASFIADPEVRSFHQEHPVSYDVVNHEMYRNYCYYQHKHPHFEICLHAAFLLGLIDRLHEHVLVDEYQRLVKEFPKEYYHFIHALLHMFRTIAGALKEGRDKEEIFALLRIETMIKKDSPVWDERNKLEQAGLSPELVKLFDDIRCIDDRTS